MIPRKFVKPAAAVAAFATILLAGMLSSSPRVKATDDEGDDRNESRIHRGLEIAPVPLNLEGKNRALVGLGSYIVNEHVPCNECHGEGPAITQFMTGQNPYFGLDTVTNPATYYCSRREFRTIDSRPYSNI